MMFPYANQMSGWMWLLMGLGQIAFWGAVIAGAVAVYRLRGPSAFPPGQSPREESPQQILAGRFARGDIDESEYRQRLSVLNLRTGEPVIDR